MGTGSIQRVEDSHNEDPPLQRKTFVARNGGPTVFSFMLARILGCAALVGLSVPNAASRIQKVGLYEAWTTDEYASILLANVSGVLSIVVVEELTSFPRCTPSFSRFVPSPTSLGENS